MQGLHLTADRHNCRCEARWLLDANALGDWCTEVAASTGLQPVGKLFHTFAQTGTASGGAVIVLLLDDETQINVHTWPAQKAVALDLYVSTLNGKNPAVARSLMLLLANRFLPEWTEQRSLDRGDES